MNKPATKFSFENNIFDIIRYYAMLQVMVNHMAEHFKLQLPAVLQALIKFQGVVNPLCFKRLSHRRFT